MLILTLLSASCETIPASPPNLYFPTFPDPTGFVTLDKSTNTVSMPLRYWLYITDYKLSVDAAKMSYDYWLKGDAYRETTEKAYSSD